LISILMPANEPDDTTQSRSLAPESIDMNAWRAGRIARDRFRRTAGGAVLVAVTLLFSTLTSGQSLREVVVLAGGIITPASGITKLDGGFLAFEDRTGARHVLRAMDLEFAGTASDYLRWREQREAPTTLPVKVEAGYVMLELRSDRMNTLFFGLDSETVNAELRAQTGAAEGEAICALPCVVRVPVGAYTAFLGTERRRNRSVALSLTPGGSEQLSLVQEPNGAAQRAGIAVGVVGGLVALAGAEDVLREGRTVPGERSFDPPIELESRRSGTTNAAMVSSGMLTVFCSALVWLNPGHRMRAQGSALRR
jgi:hypothetical protein